MQLPWEQISHFTKGKVSEYYHRKHLKRKKCHIWFNDQFPKGERRNNMTFNPLWTTDLLQFNFVVKLGQRDKFQWINWLYALFFLKLSKSLVLGRGDRGKQRKVIHRQASRSCHHRICMQFVFCVKSLLFHKNKCFKGHYIVLLFIT